jgi:hypothetical protein
VLALQRSQNQGSRMLPLPGVGAIDTCPRCESKNSSPRRTGNGSPGGSLHGNFASKENGPAIGTPGAALNQTLTRPKSHGCPDHVAFTPTHCQSSRCLWTQNGTTEIGAPVSNQQSSGSDGRPVPINRKHADTSKRATGIAVPPTVIT